MQYYMAPLEGVTGYIYRNTYQKYFHNIDKYFAPFISPGKERSLSPKEMKDILPENNRDINLVPQILTNNADAFLDLSNKLEEMGYTEVNLNLGCPSGTVVAKNKGAGMLKDTDRLDHFLEDVFNGMEHLDHKKMKVSIKTRIGVYAPDEFLELNQIFNNYPIQELIIHPRIQQEFYKFTPHYEIFEEAISRSEHELCYNGDVFTKEDANHISERFPNVERVMFGRGILSNPGLVGEINGQDPISNKVLKEFLKELSNAYAETMSGDRNVLFRMKEIWFYIIWRFPGQEKLYKKIKKAQNLREYNSAVDQILRD